MLNAWRSLGAVTMGLVFSLAAVAAEGDKPQANDGEKKEVKVQTTCPVMGGKIDKEIFTDYDGKRIYFCCKGCPPEFAKDPAKYVKKLEDEGVTLEKVPAKEGSKDGAGAKSGKAASAGCHMDGVGAKTGGGCCR
jgi:YHS domain-containing protein